MDFKGQGGAHSEELTRLCYIPYSVHTLEMSTDLHLMRLEVMKQYNLLYAHHAFRIMTTCPGHYDLAKFEDYMRRAPNFHKEYDKHFPYLSTNHMHPALAYFFELLLTHIHAYRYYVDAYKNSLLTLSQLQLTAHNTVLHRLVIAIKSQLQDLLLILNSYCGSKFNKELIDFSLNHVKPLYGMLINQGRITLWYLNLEIGPIWASKGEYAKIEDLVIMFDASRRTLRVFSERELNDIFGIPNRYTLDEPPKEPEKEPEKGQKKVPPGPPQTKGPIPIKPMESKKIIVHSSSSES